MKKIFPNHKRSGGEEPLLLAVCAHERMEREFSAVVKLSAEGITEFSKEIFGEAFR
ncbi:hypothetical protein HUK80_17780 [Flavobacterium sp. MAH-1]|uniref:Uncharacterized protein n=1 Tax=Flavobacterium agri TaxID=2743471 RepID=A0A7Y9C6X9_9FLAO|nr:hypothetical protein [Flavobacterium agri]NUY82758.1 hypothetical protein [Flavobacterium agri]NYA72781.1 hypothetical protein [Flavobacterium agri]